MGNAPVPPVDGRVLLQLDQSGGSEKSQHQTDPGGARAVPVYGATGKGGHRVAQSQLHG